MSNKLKEFLLEWLEQNADRYDLVKTENGWVESRQGFYETLEQFLEAHFDEIIDDVDLNDFYEWVK